MSYNVMGLDSSTKTGLVILSSTLNILYSVVIKSHHKGLKEADRISLKCEEICKKYQVTYVFLEGLAWSVQNKNVLDLLAQINIMIRYRIMQNSVLYLVPPLTLKKFICGNGRAKKSDMKKALQSTWNIYLPNDNVRDAAALALLGHHYLSNSGGPFLYNVSTKITKVR